jgi:hypothetical protein
MQRVITHHIFEQKTAYCSHNGSYTMSIRFKRSKVLKVIGKDVSIRKVTAVELMRHELNQGCIVAALDEPIKCRSGHRQSPPPPPPAIFDGQLQQTVMKPIDAGQGNRLLASKRTITGRNHSLKPGNAPNLMLMLMEMLA